MATDGQRDDYTVALPRDAVKLVGAYARSWAPRVRWADLFIARTDTRRQPAKVTVPS